MVCPPATSEAEARWPRFGLVVVATYRVDHKVGQFFFKESIFQIVLVFCATKIFFLIFDTFKKKTDQVYGPPYIVVATTRTR
jgi:hypothetical protein